MSTFTLDDLRAAMREAVGTDSSVDLAGDIADIEFAHLGYDSLAVLELTNHIQRTWGVTVADETALKAATPGMFVAYVNKTLTEAGR
ncbi:acyl carrier protein [Streptomyces gamaensis]|uniref:Acyl carrier protein n=1 Tax=Streptomyces gamaensis TaxID=1763542 RepID=A0ABW0Z5T3_9ACTN